MKKNRISVIIPVYNEGKYIGECLSSLCRQTLLPDEVIVVDDGSTDVSTRVLADFQSLKFNYRVFHQEHSGAGAARNFGSEQAMGEILVFVDGDMKFDKDYLRSLSLPIIQGRAEATFTREEFVANTENTWSKCWSVNSYLPTELHIDPEMPDEVTNFRAIKRSVFKSTKGFIGQGYGDDVSVLMQLTTRAKVAERAKCYHYNPSSLVEVFVSSRWMGRGKVVPSTLRSLLIYSLPNSLRRGILEAVRRRMIAFVLFKVVADFGVFVGLVDQRLGRSSYK